MSPIERSISVAVKGWNDACEIERYCAVTRSVASHRSCTLCGQLASCSRSSAQHCLRQSMPPTGAAAGSRGVTRGHQGSSITQHNLSQSACLTPGYQVCRHRRRCNSISDQPHAAVVSSSTCRTFPSPSDDSWKTGAVLSLQR